jgi:hypothetical protein
MADISFSIKKESKKMKNNEINKPNFWTEEEDRILKEKAEEFNYKNWNTIANFIPGRTSIQCSARYRRIRPGLVKGAWDKDEDMKLLSLYEKYGKNWAAISKEMPHRTGKQIRDRFLNSLDTKFERGKFTEEEDQTIIKYYKIYGNSWAKIAKKLKTRTGDMVKNRFYSSLKKSIIKNKNFLKRKRERAITQKSKNKIEDENIENNNENKNYSNENEQIINKEKITKVYKERENQKKEKHREKEANEPKEEIELKEEKESKEQNEFNSEEKPEEQNTSKKPNESKNKKDNLFFLDVIKEEENDEVNNQKNKIISTNNNSYYSNNSSIDIENKNNNTITIKNNDLNDGVDFNDNINPGQIINNSENENKLENDNMAINLEDKIKKNEIPNYPEFNENFRINSDFFSELNENVNNNFICLNQKDEVEEKLDKLNNFPRHDFEYEQNLKEQLDIIFDLEKIINQKIFLIQKEIELENN